MATEYPINIKCPFCSGTGIKVSAVGEEQTSIPCVSCSESGFSPYAVLAYPDGIIPSYKVLEATDRTEYQALSADDKLLYTAVLSAGFVDLNDGSNGRTVLIGIFGVSSETINNIKELV